MCGTRDRRRALTYDVSVSSSTSRMQRVKGRRHVSRIKFDTTSIRYFARKQKIDENVCNCNALAVERSGGKNQQIETNREGTNWKIANTPFLEENIVK